MRAMIIVPGLFVAASTCASAWGTVDKARLQTAMQRHIERHTVDGAMLYFDPETGVMKPL